MKTVTDIYDELMADTGAVADCMVNALHDTDKTSYAQGVAQLVQIIEKNGESVIKITKIKLADLIVSATTDDAFKTAEELAERGPE